MRAGDVVVLPDYVCGVLLHPLNHLKIEYQFYPVDDTLRPDWAELEKSVKGSKCRAVLMVNYFGQPQQIERFQGFCSRHGLMLLEDNAHGHGGRWDGRDLGSFGDIGISSPRKILLTPTGGILYARSGCVDSNVVRGALDDTVLYRIEFLMRCFLMYVPPLRTLLRKFMNRRKDWSNLESFKEKQLADQHIDGFSKRRIVSAPWKEIGRKRRNRWQAWQMFTQKGGLIPMFENVHCESCPWGFPAYAEGIGERNKWLKWAASRGIAAFPWPALPEAVIQSNATCVERWNRLLCFDLSQGPPRGTPHP